MFKAVLFDLDGTLLPMNQQRFMDEYFKRLTGAFSAHYNAEEFAAYIWTATKAMVKDNSPDKYNSQVFLETFLPLVNHSEEEILPMFDAFYTTKFTELEEFTDPTPLAKKVVSAVVQKNIKIALATNPLFPAAAIQARMKWAGIADQPWEVVTTYENSRYCKPNPAYYAEILRELKVEAHQALMVGNDTLEDLVAGKLGIKTYLVTDCMIDSKDSPLKPDASGTLADFYHLVENNFKGIL
ncbi:HAD family hydrolase [Desulfofalx alkaliphila]|uniref:HAD family hydrolase n=1 Tax=Desulfofalx alkaliphila TaxID=105483 RepID=UPI0004E1AD55|nr:HAD family hydrolase [Desulfofalx alkaliphila]